LPTPSAPSGCPRRNAGDKERVADFKPAEELLEKGDLKAIFQIAIAEGCAVIPTDIDR
jgi:hypothetical protein